MNTLVNWLPVILVIMSVLVCLSIIFLIREMFRDIKKHMKEIDDLKEALKNHIYMNDALYESLVSYADKQGLNPRTIFLQGALEALNGIEK